LNELEKIQKEKFELGENLHAKEIELKNLKQENSEIKNAFVKLEQGLSEKQDLLENWLKNYEKTKQDLLSCNGEIKKLKNDLNFSVLQNFDLHKEISALKKSIRDSESKYNLLSSGYDNLNIKYVENESLLQANKLKISDQETQIEKLNKILKEMKINENFHSTNLSILKDILVKYKENYIKQISNIEKIYSNKILKLKTKIKNFIKKFNTLCTEKQSDIQANQEHENKRNCLTDSLITNYKQTITTIEIEKTKLLYQIENYEKYIKEKELEIKSQKQTESIITQLNIKVEMLKKEYNKALKNNQLNSNFTKIEQELSSEKETNKDLTNKISLIEDKLEQYKIENQGKSKIIDERNEEIRKLKQELILIQK
jgi:chromosome segregation ATPase